MHICLLFTGFRVSVIVILVVKVESSTAESSKYVSPNRCDTGGQQEISIWTPTLQMQIYSTYYRHDGNSDKFLVFDYYELEESVRVANTIEHGRGDRVAELPTLLRQRPTTRQCNMASKIGNTQHLYLLIKRQGLFTPKHN